MDIRTLKDEIDRAMNVLGRDRGYLQCMTDIKGWHAQGWIDDAEYEKLRIYALRKFE